MPAPVVATLPSPKRLKGSHLNRDLSPKGKHPKPSPVKLIFPVVARNLYTGARKLVDIDLFPKRVRLKHCEFCEGMYALLKTYHLCLYRTIRDKSSELY